MFIAFQTQPKSVYTNYLFFCVITALHLLNASLFDFETGSSCVQPSTKDYCMKKVRMELISKPDQLSGVPWLIENVPMSARPRTLLPDGRMVGDPKWKSHTKTVKSKGNTRHGAAPEAPEVAQFLGLRQDYALTKCDRLLKKPEDHLAVLLELEPHALLLRELFQFYAFQGDGGDAFTISLNEITQFANDFQL